jgi:hypothetical protein
VLEPGLVPAAVFDDADAGDLGADHVAGGEAWRRTARLSRLESHISEVLSWYAYAIKKKSEAA